MAYRSSAPDLAERRDRDRDRDRFLYERDRDRYGDIRERFEEDDDHVYTRAPAAPPPPPVRERSVPRYREEDFRRRVYEDDIRRRPSSPPRRFRSPSPPPRRPGGPLLRRPSSLDTFERKEKIYYEHERERNYSPPPPQRRGEFRAPPYVDIPLPRHKALPPPRLREKEYYDEIRVSDPDRFGDDEFHRGGLVREKKVVKTRRRSVSRDRESRTTRSFRSSSRSSSSTSSSSSSSGHSSGTRTTTTITTKRSEYPKKGKTRIPARLISMRALIDLEYPFVEEGNTIVIQKALGQKNIDDLLKLSDDYKKSERELEQARSLPGDITEERRTEIIQIPTPRGPSPGHHVTFEESHVVSGGAGPGGAPVIVAAHRPPTPVEVVQQRTTTAVVRDVSPSRSYTTSSYASGTTSTSSDTYSTTSYDSSLTAVPVYVPHHHHHGHGHHHYPTTVREVSSEVPIGPLAIVSDGHRRHRSRHSHSRSRSRHARHSSIGRGGELVRAERLSTGEIVLYEESVERVEEPSKGVRIEKDRRGRMSISVPRNPR